MTANEINDVQPTSLSHIACDSNKLIIEQCRVALDAAFADNRRLDHTLMLGPPGTGKSTLSSILAAEMAVPFIECVGDNLKTAADVNNLLLQAEDKTIVHIDEVHSAPRNVIEVLYLALDKRQLFIRGKTSIMPIPLNDFTLIASTTEEADLPAPWISRMRMVLRYDFYSIVDLCLLLERRVHGLDWSIDGSSLPLLAQAARGTPRIALRLLMAARRVCRAESETLITIPHVKRALMLDGLDDLGLGEFERKYLRLLSDGPRRVNVLASAMGVPARNLSTTTEPYLIRAGLVDKDEQSRRVLLPKGRQHLSQFAR